MVVSLIGIPSKPLFFGAGGKLTALGIGDCTPLTKPPATVTAIIDWNVYGADSATPVLLDVDLNSYGPSLPIDKIRSLYIDNSSNPQTVYAIFNDTQEVIQCAAFSVCMSPIWTNDTKCKVFSTNFTDTNINPTTFIFSNVHVAEFSQISAPIVTKQKSIRRVSFQVSYGAGPNYFWSNVPLGPKAPSRLNVMVFHAVGPTALSVTPVLPASTLENIIGYSVSTVGFTSTVLAFPTTNNPALTGSIAMQYQGATSIAGVDVYALYNLDNGGTPTDVKTSINNAMVLSTTPNGVALYGATNNQSPSSLPEFVLGMANSQNIYQGSNPPNMFSDSAFQATIGTSLNVNNFYSQTNLSQVCASFA